MGWIRVLNTPDRSFIRNDATSTAIGVVPELLVLGGYRVQLVCRVGPVRWDVNLDPGLVEFLNLGQQLRVAGTRQDSVHDLVRNIFRHQCHLSLAPTRRAHSSFWPGGVTVWGNSARHFLPTAGEGELGPRIGLWLEALLNDSRNPGLVPFHVKRGNSPERAF